MQPEFIFPAHVFGQDYLGLNQDYLNQLISSIELIRRGDINGKELSNYEFGWQSDNLPQSGPFEKITQEIVKKAFIFCKNIKGFNFSKVTIGNLWANINYKGDINWPHKHSGDISGVYYLETPDNCGFLSLNYYNYNLNTKISEFFDGKGSIKILPKKDKIIFFDSNCMHYVTKNNSSKIRISISFNININD